MARMRPPPHVMMSARIHSESRQGQETVVTQLRKEGLEDTQQDDVLELLLEDLTTTEERKRVKTLFRERFGPQKS